MPKVIGYRKIYNAPYHSSIWLSNNWLGHGIYALIRRASKVLGWKTKRRYRKPRAGHGYGWGGCLKKEYAECFQVVWFKDLTAKQKEEMLRQFHEECRPLTIVSVDENGNYSCTCLAWRYRTPLFDCKHVALIKLDGGLERGEKRIIERDGLVRHIS